MKQDQKPFLNGVKPDQMLGVEDHFLVNYEHEVLKVPRNVSQNDQVDIPFEVRLPKLDRKYDECNVHTFPRRDALFDHIPEEHRSLPPRAKYKISGHLVITVCHYIKVEVCVEVNGGEEWHVEIQMVPFEQTIEKTPRNWRHLAGDDGKLLPDVQEKNTIVKHRHPFSKRSSEVNARLMTKFSNHGLLKTPLGPTRRCIISDHNLSEFLHFSVQLPTEIIQFRFRQRKVQIVETKVILVREATVIGGVHCGTDNEYSYKKQHKVYTNDLIVGQWYGREKVEVKFDKDQATIDVPQKLFRFTIGRTGESLKACNFSVDSKLLVKVRLLVGHSTEVELLETLPVMLLMPQRPSWLEIGPKSKEVEEIKAQEDEPEEEVIDEKEAERVWTAVKKAISRRPHRTMNLFSESQNGEAAWNESGTEAARKVEIQAEMPTQGGCDQDLTKEGINASRQTNEETSRELTNPGTPNDASSGDTLPNEETLSIGNSKKADLQEAPDKYSSKKQPRGNSLSKAGSSNNTKSGPISNEKSSEATNASPNTKASYAASPEESSNASFNGDEKSPRPRNTSDETLVEKESVLDSQLKAGKIAVPLPGSSSESDQAFVDCSESLA